MTVLVISPDEQDANRDQRLSSHILAGAVGMRASPPPAAGARAYRPVGASSGAAGGGSSGVQREEPWALEKLRAYLEYTRASISPGLSESAQRVLTTYYSKRRSAQDRDAARLVTSIC